MGTTSIVAVLLVTFIYYYIVVKVEYMNKRDNRIVAAILILIPFVIYFDVPFYNVTMPELAGLPFFYWFQLVMLPITAALFLAAAYLIDS